MASRSTEGACAAQSQGVLGAQRYEVVIEVFGEKTGFRQDANERIHCFTPFLIVHAMSQHQRVGETALQLIRVASKRVVLSLQLDYL